MCGRRERQMSGNRQELHPHLCWNCGKRGAPGAGSRMTCPECDVTWMPWSATARGDPNHVFWMGRLIACVDFTKPEALGAPALTKQAAGLFGRRLAGVPGVSVDAGLRRWPAAWSPAGKTVRNEPSTYS